MEILKVSAKSVPNSVAGAIAGVIREQGAVEVQAVGAGASNQAVKAVAIARGYLAPAGQDTYSGDDALHLTAGLAGCAAGVAACVAGAGRPSHVLAALLIAGGFAAMLAGWSFGLRSVVCPLCGAPLYEFPQLPWALPDRCPACGEKIDPPQE